MTPDEILEIDAQRNQPPGTVAGHLRAKINDAIRLGGGVFKEGAALLYYIPREAGVVEFHTFNANAPKDLIKLIRTFAETLKQADAKTMFTTYSNEQISKLFQKYGADFDIDITKKGSTYTAKVSL
jgi:hypothetical protein